MGFHRGRRIPQTSNPGGRVSFSMRCSLPGRPGVSPRRVLLFAAVCGLFFISSGAGSAANSPQSKTDHGIAKYTVIPLVQFYRHFISPFTWHKCTMCPSCSAYALQALEEHGALWGTFMAVDRLYHEADEMEHGKRVYRQGRFQCFHDPVKANDFRRHTAETTKPSRSEARSIAESLVP